MANYIMEDKLKEALDMAANNINTFIWKGPKINGVQEEYKLVDCTYEQLQKYYKHCDEMLHNTNKKNPGRLVLVDIVQEQIQRCRAELLIRWLRLEKSYSATRCLEDLRTIINNNPEINQETIKTYKIGNVMQGLPLEFEQLPIGLVMDACLDCLGVFDSSNITLNFIIKLGFWFTPQEMQELYRKDPETGKAMNRLAVIREKHNIDNKYTLRIDSTGLTYQEFKYMLDLKKDKYSNIASNPLKILSNKVLYRYQELCVAQAKPWQDKMNEILKVAEFKGWDVTREI